METEDTFREAKGQENTAEQASSVVFFHNTEKEPKIQPLPDVSTESSSSVILAGAAALLLSFS